MRQVRKKTADPAARSYLLKAKNEGIKLSWNQFENMLPQDGFGRLGLVCLDCLLGPCRINPFSHMEERTVCGLNRNELVYKGLYNLIGKTNLDKVPNTVAGRVEQEAENEAAAVSELEVGNLKHVNSLLKLAKRQVEGLKAVKIAQGEAEDGNEVTKKIGLGTLKEDYVNICLEGVSQNVLDIAEGLVEELHSEAVNHGAKGFNVVLAGDLSVSSSFNTVTNQGSVEFAILTGLIDLYAVGNGSLGLGRNVVSYYPTVYANAYGAESKEEVKDWFVQAAVAYTKRDANKILPSNQIQSAKVRAKYDLASLKAQLDQGTYKGVCILGGGSSVKVSEDDLLCEAAVKLKDENVLCLTYGNTAVTLGKYGLLDENSGILCLGSELDVVKVFDFIQALGADKCVALFPELVSARDLQVALSLADSGVKVLSPIKLPIEGSAEIAAEFSQLIEYVEPKELVNQAIAKLV